MKHLSGAIFMCLYLKIACKNMGKVALTNPASVDIAFTPRRAMAFLYLTQMDLCAVLQKLRS